MTIGRIVCAGGVPGRDVQAARKVLTSAGSLGTECLVAPGVLKKEMKYGTANLSQTI